jgi:hypothetical protein
LITGIRASRIGLAPIIAAIIAVLGIPAGLRIRFRRGTAIRRVAERLAYVDSWALLRPLTSLPLRAAYLSQRLTLEPAR